MNLAAHPTCAAPLTPRSNINDLESLRRRLRLCRGLPLLPRLELYLSLTPPSGLLQLHQLSIALCGHKLKDVRLEHAQVLGHLSLLKSSKLREKHSSLCKHLGDIHHRLDPLSQVQILLGQPLLLHQWIISQAEHVRELLP